MVIISVFKINIQARIMFYILKIKLYLKFKYYDRLILENNINYSFLKLYVEYDLCNYFDYLNNLRLLFLLCIW